MRKARTNTEQRIINLMQRIDTDRRITWYGNAIDLYNLYLLMKDYTDIRFFKHFCRMFKNPDGRAINYNSINSINWKVKNDDPDYKEKLKIIKIKPQTPDDPSFRVDNYE